MALVKAGLASGLKAIADDPPSSFADAASLWASELVAYASDVTPASTTVSAGEAPLKAALEVAFEAGSESGDGTPQMEAAMTAFGATIAGGMTGAGFTGAPPAGDVGFADAFSSNRDSTQAGADAVADKVDAWMKTGTATPIAPGPTIPWS